MYKIRNILLIVFLLANPCILAIADQKNNASSHSQQSNQQKKISQQEAVTIARQHINGRVLTISHIDKNFRVKILSENGSVHIIQIDDMNGSIITNP